MIDGIIKNDGTSRLMRATLPATYEEFKSACEAGTQSLDVLFNEAGWTQLPDFLNKGNLWADDTAALFGLEVDSVPNDGFKKVYEQNKNTESKITKELLLKVEDTPENKSQVSFAVDFSDYDITKYKSAIVSMDIYISENGSNLLISSSGTQFVTTANLDVSDMEYPIKLHMSYPSGTVSALVMVCSIELQFQFTKKVGDKRNLIIGTIKELGDLSYPVQGFYGMNLATGNVNRTLTFTLKNVSSIGKSAIKHIEVFGERYA